MDRFTQSDDPSKDASSQKLQSDALQQPKPEEPKSDGFTGLCAEAIHSAAYAGLQEPVTGLSQIVDKFAGTNFASNLKFMDAPDQAKFGSADWHAQQIGGAVGSLLPFMLVHKGVRSVVGAEETGMLSARAAFNMNMKEAALTGFAYDSLLKPTQVTGDTTNTQFLLDRGIHGAIGAGTFVTMTASGIGLKNLAGSSALENSAMASLLKNPVANGALSGIPAGLFNVEANSIANKGQLASASELGQGAYAMTLMGGGFGLAHSFRSSEPASLGDRSTKVNEGTARLREGLSLASGDTVTPEGTKFSVAPEKLKISTPESTLTELSRRVTGYDTTTEPLRTAKIGAPKEFSSEREFLENNVEVKDTPVRVYNVDGLETKIIVPEEYAKQLDAVRQFRLGLEGASPNGTQPIEPGLLGRALPEDFIQALDSLPNRDMVRKLILSNDANPTDPILQQQTGNPYFESQAITDRDVVTFFKKDVDPHLGDEMRHEWSHIARNQQPGQSSTFDLAAEYEGKNYIPRDRALDDKEEYQAVLMGEELLHPDAARFTELTKQVPLQSVALAESLRDAIRSAGDKPGANAELYKSRLDYIDKEVRPQVVAKLREDLNGDNVNGFATTAARLLVRLGEIDSINSSPNFKTLDLKGEPVGAGTLADLQSNHSVENLNLSQTYVGTNGLSFLEGMPLKSLDLSFTRTTPSALRSPEKISTLEDLNLRGTDMNDSAAMALRRFASLKHLDVRNTKISSKAIEWLKQQMPNTTIEH
ncbi:MAG TPA: hypothetical protein V6C76_16885 [Drouetiella sp.]